MSEMERQVRSFWARLMDWLRGPRGAERGPRGAWRGASGRDYWRDQPGRGR